MDTGIDWQSMAAGAGMTVLAHPFTYVKVLVQLGHEPIPPVLRRNMFFRKQLQYPNVFEYMKHIKKTDGFFGLYRGVCPRVCANLSASMTYYIVGDAISKLDLMEPKRSKEPVTGMDDLKSMLNKTSTEMVSRCCAVVVSQPFHVIAVRTMAEFIGHETLYNSMRSSVGEIYSQDGILGFFAGLAPRLVSEIISIWLCNLLAYAFNSYVIADSSDFGDLRQYSQIMMSYIAQSITYPLSVTSTVMAVNGARIRGGQPPFMIVYGGWFACLKDLHKQSSASRGSSMWFRKAVTQAISATSVTPMPPVPYY